MSREMLDGKREQSQLLGVRLRSEGKDYYAIRAEDGKFYDRNGTGLAKGFLRFPTAKQFRVSSNFNPRRLNPVTGASRRTVALTLPCRRARRYWRWVMAKWWWPNVAVPPDIMSRYVMVVPIRPAICTCVSCWLNRGRR
jgi:hypothetical protein